MTRTLRTTAMLLMLAMPGAAFAQTAPVTITEDFQSYGKSKKPNGWIDGKVGDLNARPRGYYNTAFDPLGDKKGPNVVFGTNKSTGSEDEERNGRRIGWFSTYVDRTFPAAGRFEFQGRIIQMFREARGGLVVLSGYPENDRYYMIFSRNNAAGNLTMQLTSFGAGTPSGKLDSEFVLDPARWYRFRILVDDVAGATNIRARFWADGTPEPAGYQIEASDASANRLKSGRFGMWAGGGRDNDDGRTDPEGQSRGVYIDDLFARSPSDTTSPVITFFESGQQLDPATVPAFNRDARIEIRITDDLSTFTSTARMDGAAYNSLDPVTTEGVHTLVVNAVDAPGNAREATLRFLVDKTPPVISLLANQAALVNGTVFSSDVTLSATIQDISATTSTATLNGNLVTLPVPVAEERNHQLTVQAKDAATNSSTKSGTFILDKTAPVISIKANGVELSSGASFRTDVTLTWTVTDLTLDQVSATLNGAPIQSGHAQSVEGVHTLVIIATDRATHTTTERRTFALAKNAPAVTLLANGVPFEENKTYNTAVRLTATVQDPTPTTKVFTVDGQPYTEDTPVTGDGLHTVRVVVTNAADLSTTVGPFNFYIDTTPPAITMTESGQPFPDGAKFTRDVNPIVTATDNLTTDPKIVVTLNGLPYPTNAPVTQERREHVISATATDNGGNSASVGPFRFMLDKTKPVVTILNAATDQPFPSDALFNTPVSVKVTVADVTNTTTVATLNGAAFSLGAPSTQADGTIVFTPAPITAEGLHTLSVVATDEVNLSNDPAVATFTIDMTPPKITFTEPEANGTVGTITVTVAGGADDAISIKINGRDALVNTASRTFTIEGVALLEGANEIFAEGVDAAGNRGTATLTVKLDTRVPELSIVTPAADGCVATANLEISGTAADPHLHAVNIIVGSNAPVPATIGGASWSASIPGLTEGKYLVTVEATDTGGHTTSVSRSVLIDRTPPSIEIRENGAPFSAAFINRPVAFLIRVNDADPATTTIAKLDGAPYVSGTAVGAEGKHTLSVVATDCAGHTVEASVEFTIDLTPPTIRNLNPANGSTVGTTPASFSGTTDADATAVAISGTQHRTTPAGEGTFAMNVPFDEGLNRFMLVATDRAGNSSSLEYVVTVKTTLPVVEIRESGLPIAANALFNRAVTPVIRSVDPQATISATLNGAPFVSGTTISNDGSYTLHATATDALGHSGTADATFTIDRTPPVVKITTPPTSTVQVEQIEVRGTAGDAISASVNGQPVALAADGTFVIAAVNLDLGPNTIVASGRDRAGNTGRDEVTVTRDDLGGGIILTYPPDLSRTNRRTTDVIGRILSPGRDTIVRIGATNVPVDTTGGFRLNGYTLAEGENTITATAITATGQQRSASTRVIADFTPPALTILESGQALIDGARFPERAIIALNASDPGGGAVTTDLTIDGSKIAAPPSTITATGGHSVVAVARDLAGNESRAERVFFIGSSTSGAPDCKLEGFDPADGAVVLSNIMTLVGRSGGAIGVKVNGVAAVVADGSFSSTVELPIEGTNNVRVVCTDANGAETGTAVTIKVQRVTGDPSITITTPEESFVTAQETIAVTGTVSAGVVSADVNGVAANIQGTDSTVPRPFTVSTVRLAEGLNVLVAHGRNAAGRVGTASRRGLYIKDAPAITISSPPGSTIVGTARISVSGTWSNLDPATLTVTNVTFPTAPLPAQVVRNSDTAGTFSVADVPLSPGEQILRASGRDRMNRPATADVPVRFVVGSPSIAIAQPADQSYFGPAANDATVTGTFQAAAGSVVDVNGVTATQTGTTYSATVGFSSLAGGITPIVARVTEPSGVSASALVTVTRLADAPNVVESFPAANAAGVDAGALLLVLFSQPMSGATMSGAFRLEDPSGAPVSGTLFLDKDVLTFAPAALLTTGAQYTLRVSTAAKNLAGTPLAAAYAAPFTVASSAPSTPPSLTPITSAVCGQSVTIAGSASPGARLQLQSGTLILNATADGTGKFTFNYPISGQSGFALVRVRVVGSDGGVSPAAEMSIRVDCAGPQVLNATYDRTVNRLTIQFSEHIDAASATVGAGNAILLTLEDGRTIAGSASVSQAIATVTPAEDLTAKTFSLSVTTSIKDIVGNRLATPYGQTFAIGGGQPQPGDGTGFISGEVYDATTGRPLSSAALTIDVASPAPVVTAADGRGRYLARLPEGAHTIKAALNGYSTVWREIIVPAGAGVIPIDIRLTRRADPQTAGGSAISLSHGGDTVVTRKIDLSVPAGALTSGRRVSLTALGGQALPGLLPLGWSPLAAGEVVIDSSDVAVPLAGAQLTFYVPASEITTAAQNLTAVQYNAARDEWNVVTAVVNVSDGKVNLPIGSSGSYALVYPDKAAGLATPPLPVAGDVLRGVAVPATASALIKRDFHLDPPVVLPSGRAVATLKIEGAGTASFPSGTAVQAYIDEELKLADGSRLLDPPFATDLLLYRTLSGDLGVADFHLAPSEKAAQVILETGVDHIRIFPYPGRLDRGTLIGSEGGRVPADDKVAIDVPTGAVPEPLRVTATSLTTSDVNAIGAISGFRVVGGFQLTLQRSTQPPAIDLDGDGQIDPIEPPALFVPARVTFTVESSTLPANAQVILGELLDVTPYGRMIRLAVPMMLVDGAQTSTPAVRFTSKPIDRSVLPVDGVIREGRYVLLASEAPIAFATGAIRNGGTAGRLLGDARVIAPPLGVADLTRSTGIYNIPVPSKPAGPFALVPRHTATGDGATYTHGSAVDPDTVTRVDLALVAQPPVLSSVTVLKGDPPSQGTLSAASLTVNVALTTNIRASFSPAIDPASVAADSIVVTDAATGKPVPGSAGHEGTLAVLWTLTAGERFKPSSVYVVTIAPTVRGTNGALLGHGARFTFSTVAQIVSSDVNRDRIRITIPNANGVSKIIGAAGALPAGWQAVAIRRGRDFITRYQATAASDGSFSFDIGNGGDPADRVTIADLVDLQVVSNVGNLAAIIALTPFASEDGKSFVVPAGQPVRYTTPEGLTLEVPAGAFDVPTVISMTPATKQEFTDVPALDDENQYLGSVNISFEGRAKKPLMFEAPVPAGFVPSGNPLLLVEKYMSSRGPRLAMIDLLRIDDNKITTKREEGQSLRVVNLETGVTETLTGSRFSKYIRYLMGSGIYMYVDLRSPSGGLGGAVGFGAMQSLQASYDIMWDIYASYIVPHIHVFESGGALLPIVTGKRFTVTGVDPGTGLQAFSRTYDPIPFGPPGTVVPIPSAQQNDSGPYPVFGGPYRVEMLDLDVTEIEIRSIRNFSVILEGGEVTVRPGETPLAEANVELLNITNGTFISGTSTAPLSLPAKQGDRIVLLVEQHDIDPNLPVSVVFNEPIWVGDSTDPDLIDQFLHGVVKVEVAPQPPTGTPPVFSDITAQVRFTTDSGNRRINIAFPSALQRGSVYRLTLSKDIADVVEDAPGLRLGEGTFDDNGTLKPTGGGNPFHLSFDVREPAGELASFSAAPNGLIRGMDLAGNVLIVAAWDGGLLSYDVSNPAAATPDAPPLGKIPGPPNGTMVHLAVTVDRHNRVYTTAHQPVAGMFASYRVEDLVAAPSFIPWKGSKVINWKMGYSSMLGLVSNTLLSDVPESIPFRIKVVLQDDEQTFKNRKEFVDVAKPAMTGEHAAEDLRRYTLTVPRQGTLYKTQRVTVENLTLDMRWSADATDNPAVIHNIIARSTDKLRLIRNNRTYAIVAHLGYGIGVYDANAIESNRYAGLHSKSPGHLTEQMVLTAGKIDWQCPNKTPDYGIIENYVTTDAELRGDESGNLYAYFTDNYRGLLDLRLKLPSPTSAGTRDDDCDQRPNPNTGGLLFRSTPAGHEPARIQALRPAVMGALGREPFMTFSNMARYRWSVTAEENKKGLRGTQPNTAAEREYLLITGGDYGIIVVDIEGRPPVAPLWPLGDANIADVIWIPGGAINVRVYQSANIAVVGDRYGRVLLVDLSRIDERWNEEGGETTGLFPTAKKALSSAPNDLPGAGADDPRIIWKSEPGLFSGMAAPLFDPLTGYVFVGTVQRQVKVLSAIDPRLRVLVNLGNEKGLEDVGGVVPLGIPMPKDVEDKINALPACDGSTAACRENASLGAFRLEVALPGNMVDSLTLSNNELQLAVESERMPGAITEQTPSGFPRAHLRRTRRDGSDEAPGRAATSFTFKRIVPQDWAPALKSQRGYNRFMSPWIVAIADPRASKDYDWDEATSEQKKEAGCDQCNRPKHLEGKSESDGVFELWTNGRYIAVRPELKNDGSTIFDTTRYEYLGRDERLLGRFTTIMADTVRPTEVLVAAQNPPVATGALQEGLFLHSGELQTTSNDLNAGGRAGLMVAFDRLYRSRTIGGTVLGQGWDSSLLRRLRALPTGDIEYRDGAEVWMFRMSADRQGYVSPKGLFLKLSRTSRGWKMIDQRWRISEFDDYGRLLYETDEFYDPQSPASGNVIRYVYDETGRLSQVIDPIQRSSTFSYWRESEAAQQGAYPGLLKATTDWRGRKIDYAYDQGSGTLTSVALPIVENTAGSRPTIKYAYAPAGGSYNDILELRPNMQSITEPEEAAASGPARVTFGYGNGSSRDHVVSQTWATGEEASFVYNSATDVRSTDVLGQIRKYTLTPQPIDRAADRAHIETMIESAVPTSSTAAFGQLPGLMTPSVPSTTPVERTTSFTYHADGLIDTAKLDGVRSTKNIFKSVEPEAPGSVIASSTTTALGGSAETITKVYTYQTGPNRSTFLASITANGKKIEMPEANRANKSLQSANDNVSATETYDTTGLLRGTVGSGGLDSSSEGSDTQISYNPSNDGAPHQRSLASVISVGGLKTELRYPNADQAVATDPRGVVTTTDQDAWQRPVHVTSTGPQMTLDERFVYDATGRLRANIRKQGSEDVTTSYLYDPMGRTRVMSVDKVANGSGTIATVTTYDLRNRTIITDHPGGSRTTVRLDTLGRTVSSETTTGGAPIVDHFAYDLAGNLVYRTDGQTASAAAYDAHGRMIGTKAPDGTEQITDFDPWGNPKAVRRYAADGSLFGESTLDLTEAGAVRGATVKVDSAQTRLMDYAWDGARRATGTGASGRANRSRFDKAGRLLSTQEGSGSALGITTVFNAADLSSHAGTLPQKVQARERTGTAYQLALEYNTAADITAGSIGSLEWQQNFDQAGNTTSLKAPNRSAHAYDYDSRGLLKRETLPGGASNKYDYHDTGSLTGYTDPGSEVTQTIPDLLGRPLQRIYKDGTQEVLVWEGRRLKSFRDRQGRLQNFRYNSKGQIEAILGAGDVPIDRIFYDSAGRIMRWENDDSIVEYSNFDYEGRPRRTSQARYRNGVLVDQYTQDHAFNVHGDRTFFTMPTYTGFASTRPWTKSVDLDHDAMGNLATMKRTLFGTGAASPLFNAEYRNADRPDQRTIITASGTSILRQYSYQADTGQLSQLAVSANGATVAGSAVTFDGVQKRQATLLGVSGGARRNEWRYDPRSRLQHSILARDEGSAAQTDELSVADFRNALVRPQSTPADPPSVVFRESPLGGHKIDKVERGVVVEQFSFTGGERTSDGKFVYQYDVKGRLIAVTGRETTPPIRRVLYYYNGNDRLIGRRAEYSAVSNPSASDWKLEDRNSILSADGLPADTTFVWDPITDRLVSLFQAGSSQNPVIDANGGLLRQIIHGGSGYDDPLEVITVDVTSPSGVGYLYPVYDEAGAGSLQVILNQAGRVITRNLAAGPYGEDETVLLGPAVDKVLIEARKNSDGSLREVTLSIRATERITEASLANGVRLATVTSAGAVVRTSSAEPALDGDSTIRWTLTRTEWDELTVGAPTAVGLSIAVTNTLRAGDWSASLPFLPAPAWATASKPVFTSAALPVEVRESLANLAQWLASIGDGDEKTNVLYEVPTLLALGTPRLGAGGASQLTGDPQLLIVSSGFHAHPFQDPFTGKNYVRARWFDGQNGVWLTPDASGYQDSSNLYAFAGADPVNRRDPTGLDDEIAVGTFFPRDAAEFVWGLMKLGVSREEAFKALEKSSFKGTYDPFLLALKNAGDYSAYMTPRLVVTSVGAGVGQGVGLIALLKLGITSWVGGTLITGATSAIGSQASNDLYAGEFSGARQYAETATTGAVTSLGFGAALKGLGRILHGPNGPLTIVPADGWSFPRPIPQTGRVPLGPERQLTAGTNLPKLDNKIAVRSPRDINVSPVAPAAKTSGSIGLSPTQYRVMQQDMLEAHRLGATDIRVNQHMVNLGGTRVGINRPDLQFTLNGKRYYIEYDTPASGRGLPHQMRILMNEPNAVVILKIVP